MLCDCTLLSLTELEELPQDTSVFQLESGLLFYYKYSAPQRLYIKWEGIKLNAKLPEQWLSGVGAIGNELYFVTEQKIYKAAFDPSKGITVDLVRALQHEVAYCGALLSRERNGKTIVYRMNENPDRDGIVVDASTEELEGLRLSGLHRGKIIYRGTNVDPVVREIGKNVIVIKFPLSPGSPHYSLHPDHSSPFIYITNAVSMFTLNADNMHFLPTQRLGSNSIKSIVGVSNGIITMHGENANGQGRLFSAELHEAYKLAEDATIAAFHCDCF